MTHGKVWSWGRRIVCANMLVFAVMLGINGCSHLESRTTPACEHLMLQKKLLQALASDGIQVVLQGDEVTIYLPADQFFYSQSNHMRYITRDKKLDDVISFINTWQTVAINITGYTDDRGDDVRNLALSRAQAQAIVNYLLQQGLNTRLVTAEGKGGCVGAIADNNVIHGRKANRRIEIFFRLPPPDNVFL